MTCCFTDFDTPAPAASPLPPRGGPSDEQRAGEAGRGAVDPRGAASSGSDGAKVAGGSSVEAGASGWAGSVGADEPPELAAVVSRSDWSAHGLSEASEALSVSQRRALASHWAQVGRVEHAQLAGFARFALRLLALGAPAHLIEQTNAALADCTEHAKAAFALASRFERRPVGPGPLASAAAVESARVEQIVVDAIVDGCLGSALAALEAADAHARARDAQVLATLGAMAANAHRHAELAWQFVSWVLAEFGEGLRAPVVQAFEQGFSRAVSARPGGAGDDELAAYGLVHERRLRAVRRLAVARVVQPCREALLRGEASSVRVTAHSAVEFEAATPA